MRIRKGDITVSPIEGEPSIYNAKFTDCESPFLDDEYDVIFMLTSSNRAVIMSATETFDGVTMRLEGEDEERKLAMLLDKYLQAHVEQFEKTA